MGCGFILSGILTLQPTNVARFRAAEERRSERPEVMRTIINNSNLTLFFSPPSTSWFHIPGPLDACVASYWAASQEKLTPVKFNKKKRLRCQKLARPPNARPTLFFPFDNKPAMLIIFNGTVCFYFTVFSFSCLFLLAIFPGGCSFSCALRFRVSIFIFPSTRIYVVKHPGSMMIL